MNKPSKSTIKFTAAVAAELAAVSFILMGAGAISANAATSSETSVSHDTVSNIAAPADRGDAPRCFGYY